MIITVNLMKEIQRDPSDQASVPTHMPQVFTCEAACIYNTNGKCVGKLTRERLQNLPEAYRQPKWQACTPPSNHPSRIQQQKSWASYHARRLKKSNSLLKTKRLAYPMD
eukprot:1137186-Pelagomonas_calceolata.AAC.6